MYTTCSRRDGSAVCTPWVEEDGSVYTVGRGGGPGMYTVGRGRGPGMYTVEQDGVPPGYIALPHLG